VHGADSNDPSSKEENVMKPRLALYCTLLAVALPAAALAQPQPEGYLCCNMRTDGGWISDINHAESGKRIIPVGTPIKVTGYGRYRVHVEVNNGRQSIGNDYSRDIELGNFALRYVTSEDPRTKMAGFPPRVQQAITSAQVMKGMTREQVLMAVGYPVSSENPSLDARVWRFWLSSFAEFQVVFGSDGRVSEISTDSQTRDLVVAE
jgi:hypothetical protein